MANGAFTFPEEFAFLSKGSYHPPGLRTEDLSERGWKPAQPPPSTAPRWFPGPLTISLSNLLAKSSVRPQENRSRAGRCARRGSGSFLGGACPAKILQQRGESFEGMQDRRHSWKTGWPLSPKLGGSRRRSGTCILNTPCDSDFLSRETRRRQGTGLFLKFR